MATTYTESLVTENLSYILRSADGTVSSSFTLDPKSLKFVTSDNLVALEINAESSNVNGEPESWLRGVWSLDTSPNIPQAISEGQAVNLAQLRDAIREFGDTVTLQDVYDNVDEGVNGFTGLVPTELRVGSSVIKLSNGNLALGLMDSSTGRTMGWIDFTAGKVTLSGSVLVPDVNASSDLLSAVNLRRLRAETDSLLNGDNTWTKVNLFSSGLKSSVEPIEDDDVVTKVYVGSVTGDIGNAVEEIKRDLDTFEAQYHSWTGENRFKDTNVVLEGTTITTDATTFTNNSFVTKAYVDESVENAVVTLSATSPRLTPTDGVINWRIIFSESVIPSKSVAQVKDSSGNVIGADILVGTYSANVTFYTDKTFQLGSFNFSIISFS